MSGDCFALKRSSLLVCALAALSSITFACSKPEPQPGAAADPAAAADPGHAAAPAVADADPKFLADIAALVDTSYKGTSRTPPTAAAKPQRGKKVWIISPGQVGESASIPTNAAKDAGTAVGWKMTLYDSKLDVTNFSLGIRQAIAAKADGIILQSIDCPLVKQALMEAHAAKVKVVAYYSLDCDDPTVKGQPLFDGTVNNGAQLGDFATLNRAWGAVKADWLINKLHGHVKAISFKEDELLIVKYIREGFEQELAKCKTCEIVKTVDFTLADLGPKLQQKAQSALLQHPEANAIHVPYDSAVLLGVASAVLESGRNDQIEVIGGEGFPSNLALIRDNKGQDAANAFPAKWTGYASIDTMNSVFHGQVPQDSGAGWQLIDRDHNMPPKGQGYEPTQDYRAAYLKAWGVSR